MISEGFWELDRIKKSQSQFWKIWKLGGILGACLGSVLALFVGIDLLFIIAATMAFLGFIMNLFISLFQKGKKGY